MFNKQLLCKKLLIFILSHIIYFVYKLNEYIYILYMLN